MAGQVVSILNEVLEARCVEVSREKNSWLSIHRDSNDCRHGVSGDLPTIRHRTYAAKGEVRRRVEHIEADRGGADVVCGGFS